MPKISQIIAYKVSYYKNTELLMWISRKKWKAGRSATQRQNFSKAPSVAASYVILAKPTTS